MILPLGEPVEGAIAAPLIPGSNRSGLIGTPGACSLVGGSTYWRSIMHSTFAKASIRIAALLFLLGVAGPLHAPSAAPLVYLGPGTESDPANALSRYLRMLAANPRDLASLTGAGKAALAIGDPSAALGFYARAEEIAPRDGRIKAGLASALVQMEQPKTALKLFGEAVALGVPEADIASDRGLARDLGGDNRRAQADYVLALRKRDDPEATRRLALSLAISGDRASALARLDPLIRKRDKAAWRARAFVLALTGDTAGASSVAAAVMPALHAAAMKPFLAKLADLKAGQKAAAVHFGHFPANGHPYSDAELFADAAPATSSVQPAPGGRADMPLIPAGIPLGRGKGRGGKELDDDSPSFAAPSRRRRGRDDEGRATPADRARPGKPQPEASRSALSSPEPVPPKVGARPFEPVTGRSVASDAARKGAQSVNARNAGSTLPPSRLAELSTVLSQLAAAEAPPPLVQVQPPPKPSPPAVAEKSKKEKAGKTAKTVAAKDKRDSGATKVETAAAKATPDAKGKADRKEKAKVAVPERYWVQVASGSNKGALVKVWSEVKAKSPKLLGGRSPWTAPWRASNRLLTGPFKSEDEAQAFVNRLAKEGVSSIQFTTRSGVEVEQLAAK